MVAWGLGGELGKGGMGQEETLGVMATFITLIVAMAAQVYTYA